MMYQENELSIVQVMVICIIVFEINDYVGVFVLYGCFILLGVVSGLLVGLCFVVKDLFDVVGYLIGVGNLDWLCSYFIFICSNVLVD